MMPVIFIIRDLTIYDNELNNIIIHNNELLNAKFYILYTKLPLLKLERTITQFTVAD